MSLKYYLDRHVAKQVAIQLRERGVDVVRCEEVGMGDASDLDHLTYAAEQKRTLVSMDDDFLRLHNQWLSEHRDHAGIIRLPHHLQGEDGIGTIVRTLFEYYEIIESDAGTLEEDILNRVIFVG